MADLANDITTVKREHEKAIEATLGKFVFQRPSDENLGEVKDTYTQAIEKFKEQVKELASQREGARALKEVANFFIRLCVSSCDSAWRTSVGYNYYRDAFSTLGKSWTHDKRWVETNTNAFRPMKDTWDRFVHETDNLINLLIFAEKQINDRTDPELAKKLFLAVAFYEECVINSGSWKIMQGYAGNLNSKKIEGWHEEYSLSQTARTYRQKFADQNKEKAKKIPEKLVKRQIELKEADRLRSIADYWRKHKKEYAELKKTKEELQDKIEAARLKLAETTREKNPRIKELNRLLKQPSETEQKARIASEFIKDLEFRKNNLKVFMTREKKELQEKIKAENEKLAALENEARTEREQINKQANEELAAIQAELDAIKSEIEALEKKAAETEQELTKDR